MPIGSLPPLSLYVHIPWCVRKCPYCDFNSHAAGDVIPENDYVSAVVADLEEDAAFAQGRSITSVFIGGGTPSLFSDRAIGNILDAVDQQLGLASDAEITLEANPGTVDESHFKGYRHAGVNRLSIGVQSFNAAHLTTLGRIHSPQQARHAVNVARNAGFDNINLDLMYGLPGQTLQECLADLKTASELAPEHLSWYELTLEPNTAFYSAPPALPAEDHIVEMENAGRAYISQAGFNRYEISAYAQANRQSRHNVNYWKFGDYLGVGAGAHGKITLLDNQSVMRYWKTRTPKDYLAKSLQRTATRKEVDTQELAFEFLMNALRLSEGVDESLFYERTGIPLNTIAKARISLIEQGLLENSSRLQTTKQGSQLLNSVLQGFLA